MKDNVIFPNRKVNVLNLVLLMRMPCFTGSINYLIKILSGMNSEAND